MSVIPFGRRPEKPGEGEEPKDPHLCGEAFCLSCAKTWTAVTPTGSPVNVPDEEALGLECPACGSEKGVLRRFVMYEDVKIWHCQQCRGVLWSLILAKGDVPCVSCACCGNLVNALDLFNK